MTIEDNIKICEALGLDAGKVKMLEIRIYPQATFIEATISVEPDSAIGELLVSVLKKYTIVEVPDTQEVETPDAEIPKG